MSSEAARAAATKAAQKYLQPGVISAYPPTGRVTERAAERWLRQTYAAELIAFAETFQSVLKAGWRESHARRLADMERVCATLYRVDHPAGCRCDHCTGACEHRERED